MRLLVPVLVLFALLPATAAAAPPVATTGGVADVAQTTATLLGKVDPNGHAVAISFKFGPTTAYGAQTIEAAGTSTTNVQQVTAPITGLAPFTRYHYRIVVRYGDKTVQGKDRVFRTKRQPLGLSLSANPSNIAAGGDTTLIGNLAGTGNAGRQVLLQANPAPYTAGFQNVGNPQVVGPTGDFSFPILNQTVSTQYRVVIPDKPDVVSPIAFVGVRVAVSTKVRKVGKRRYRFSGRLTPSTNGIVSVQRKRNGRWKTVETDVTENGRYRIAIKIRRRGTFRVGAIDLANLYVGNVGRRVRVGPKK